MKPHIQSIKDDFRNARHHVEDRLSLGAAFDPTVREFMCEDNELMRDFVRDCRLDCLRDSFEKNRADTFSDVMLNFVKQIEEMRKLTRRSDTPYIKVTPTLLGEIDDHLRIAGLMRQHGHAASALLVEERIATEFMPRMRDMKDRNHVRGMMLKHEMGLY